jgi:hypothetical protein
LFLMDNVFQRILANPILITWVTALWPYAPSLKPSRLPMNRYLHCYQTTWATGFVK